MYDENIELASENNLVLFLSSTQLYRKEINYINSNFTNCRAGFGGAILHLGGALYVNNCRFLNNKAIYDGGAIYTSYTGLNVKNSLFKNNKNLISNYNLCKL